MWIERHRYGEHGQCKNVWFIGQLNAGKSSLIEAMAHHIEASYMKKNAPGADDEPMLLSTYFRGYHFREIFDIEDDLDAKTEERFLSLKKDLPPAHVVLVVNVADRLFDTKPGSKYLCQVYSYLRNILRDEKIPFSLVFTNKIRVTDYVMQAKLRAKEIDRSVEPSFFYVESTDSLTDNVFAVESGSGENSRAEGIEELLTHLTGDLLKRRTIDWNLVVGEYLPKTFEKYLPKIFVGGLIFAAFSFSYMLAVQE